MSNSNYTELQNRFDTYCKKILKNTARNIDKKRNLINDNEVILSSLHDPFIHNDEYFKHQYIFYVNGLPVLVLDENIAEVLSSLTETNRSIILMSYYMDMTDKQISESINIPLSTVHYRRNKTLEYMKSRLERLGNISDE